MGIHGAVLLYIFIYDAVVYNTVDFYSKRLPYIFKASLVFLFYTKFIS